MHPRRLFRPANFLIVVIIVGLFLVSLPFLRTDERRGSREETSAQIPRVYVKEAVRTLFEESFESIGQVKGWREVVLSSEVRGRATEVLAEMGDTVAEGQLLLQLDDRERSIDLREKQANLEKAQAKVQNAEWSHKRKARLHEQRLLSEEDLQIAIYELESAKAEFLAAQASLDRAAHDLENTRIRAPFAGTIVERSVEQGQTVDPTSPLFTLVDLRWISITVGLTDQELARVLLDQRVEVHHELYPSVIDGIIYAIAEKSDDTTNTYRVKIRVENSRDHPLLSGMVARVKFPWRVLEETVVIPEVAVLRDGTDAYVFTVSDGLARRVDIEPIASRNSLVAIEADLQPGDLVVTLGHAALSDGAAVVVAGSEDGREEVRARESE